MNDLDARLQKTLTHGFQHADALISRMLGRAVSHHGYHFGLHSVAEISTEKINLLVNEESMLLITTNIFGVANGKSYLLLSEEEMDMIIQLKELEEASQDMKISFIKEIANILSAAVITVLSNEFGIKAFGDIPVLHASDSVKIEDMIRSDFNAAQWVYIVCAHLQTEIDPNLNLAFIWVIAKDSPEIFIREKEMDSKRTHYV